MKFAVVLLVLVPLALSMEVDKRSILDFLGFGDGVFSLDYIKQTAQKVLNEVGSDATEQQCESACHNILSVDEGNLIHTLCNPLCRSFQFLVGLFHLIPGLDS